VVAGRRASAGDRCDDDEVERQMSAVRDEATHDDRGLRGNYQAKETRRL
jgi:hypothetical protein